MIVERVPDFLCSSNEYNTYFFDKNGRYIYIQKSLGDLDPKFIIYDVMFNDELSADSSMLELKYEEPFAISIRMFLPIDTKNMLFTMRGDQKSTVLGLIHFNLEQKIYGLLDQILIENCQNVSLVRDDDIFGLLFTHSMDEWPNSYIDNDHTKLAFLMFEIKENRIQIDFTKRKEFNYKPFNHACTPGDVHLRRNKLWFIRRKDHIFQWARNPMCMPPVKPEPDPDFQISYFDLEQEHPTEMQVGTVSLDLLKEKAISLMIYNTQWVKDFLLLQFCDSKFGRFDLLQFEWAEPIELSLCFGEPFPGEKMNEEWAVFEKNKMEHNDLVSYSQLDIDNDFILTCVNVKSKTLHRIPLRNPIKLTDIAWTKALNSKLLDKIPNSVRKIPYS